LSVLFVTPFLPSPPSFGAQRRLHELISGVAASNDVSVLSLVDPTEHYGEAIRATEEYCRRVVTVSNPAYFASRARKRLRQLVSLAVSYTHLLRWPLLVTTFLALTLENPSDTPACGQWKSPFYDVGAVLLVHLNVTFPFKALAFSGLDVIVVYLFVIAAIRNVTGSRIDAPAGIRGAGPVGWFAGLSLAGAAWMWVYGIAAGDADVASSLWQIQRVEMCIRDRGSPSTVGCRTPTGLAGLTRHPSRTVGGPECRPPLGRGRRRRRLYASMRVPWLGNRGDIQTGKWPRLHGPRID